MGAAMNIHIPPAALEAGARALADAYYRNCSDGRLTLSDTDDTPEDWYAEARAAFLAMVEAWPGSYSLAENDSAEIRGVAAIILPLTQETRDE